MGFFRCLRAERIKLKRAPVWIAFLVLPAVAAAMGTFNYLQNLGILTQQWYSLWSQHTLFSSNFFLPALIAVYCAYLCRLEHFGHNWNAALTAPAGVSSLYFAKLAAAACMAALTQLVTGALFILCGKLAGIQAPLPPELVSWLLLGTLAAIVIASLQLTLSLVLRSFAAPVGIGLAGGITGLLLMARGAGLWFPYSLLVAGMRATDPTAPPVCPPAQFAVICLGFISLFSAVGILWLKRRDAG